MGRSAQTRQLPLRFVRELRVIAESRPELGDYDELIHGLAHQVWNASSQAISARAIRKRLAAESSDWSARRVEAAMAVELLSRVQKEKRVTLLSDLKAMWSTEREPELRLGLASIIIATRANDSGIDEKPAFRP
jgi:hypothetical protein